VLVAQVAEAAAQLSLLAASALMQLTTRQF
jgi:hypothetical protein